MNEKKEFSARLNYVLDLYGVAPKGKGRQGELASMFNVSDKGARKWIEAESIPKMERLLEIVDRLKSTGITVDALLNANSFELFVKSLSSGHTNIHETPGMVPLISWTTAGDWCALVKDYTSIDSTDWIPCPSKHGKQSYALKVIGDSMTSSIPGAKSYPDGCIIYIDPEVEVVNGRNVVAKLISENQTTFKTYKEDMGKKWLVPINFQYDKIIITDDIMICGVVIGKFEQE
jgi:SOS-response transcriptional repressor LexA